jgi:hypothetical protein
MLLFRWRGNVNVNVNANGFVTSLHNLDEDCTSRNCTLSILVSRNCHLSQLFHVTHTSWCDCHARCGHIADTLQTRWKIVFWDNVKIDARSWKVVARHLSVVWASQVDVSIQNHSDQRMMTHHWSFFSKVSRLPSADDSLRFSILYHFLHICELPVESCECCRTFGPVYFVILCDFEKIKTRHEHPNVAGGRTLTEQVKLNWIRAETWMETEPSICAIRFRMRIDQGIHFSRLIDQVRWSKPVQYLRAKEACCRSVPSHRHRHRNRKCNRNTREECQHADSKRCICDARESNETRWHTRRYIGTKSSYNLMTQSAMSVHIRDSDNLVCQTTFDRSADCDVFGQSDTTINVMAEAKSASRRSHSQKAVSRSRQDFSSKDCNQQNHAGTINTRDTGCGIPDRDIPLPRGDDPSLRRSPIHWSHSVECIFTRSFPEANHPPSKLWLNLFDTFTPPLSIVFMYFPATSKISRQQQTVLFSFSKETWARPVPEICVSKRGHYGCRWDAGVDCDGTKLQIGEWTDELCDSYGGRRLDSAGR